MLSVGEECDEGRVLRGKKKDKVIDENRSLNLAHRALHALASNPEYSPPPFKSPQ